MTSGWPGSRWGPVSAGGVTGTGRFVTGLFPLLRLSMNAVPAAVIGIYPNTRTSERSSIPLLVHSWFCAPIHISDIAFGM